MMIFINEAYKADKLPRQGLESFVLLLAPFAPHLAEELWAQLGHTSSLTHHAWPSYDEALTKDAEVELAVQVNGKIRGRITVAADSPQDEVLGVAKAEVAADLEGKAIVKEVVVPGRLVNLVVK
jgi:leucyl-tRNA synthetase